MRIWSALLCLLMAGCGSGSKGAGGTEGNVLTPQPVPGVLRVLVSTQGPTVATVLYGAQFTLRFPAKVTLPAAEGDRILPAQAVQPAVSGSFAGASYIDTAADSGPAILVNVTHPNGLTVGPLVTVVGTLAAGATLAPTDITLADFSPPRDANGAPMPNVTATISLQTQ